MDIQGRFQRMMRKLFMVFASRSLQVLKVQRRANVSAFACKIAQCKASFTRDAVQHSEGAITQGCFRKNHSSSRLSWLGKQTAK
eukprot:6465795-Amphidinium_carterae.1